MAHTIRRVGEQICKENDTELQGMLCAAFVRLSQEASTRKSYAAVGEVCAAMEQVAKSRPVLANDLRPRIGVENRLPEFIEEALRVDQVPRDLLAVLQRTSQAAVEHLEGIRAALAEGENARPRK